MNEEIDRTPWVEVKIGYIGEMVLGPGTTTGYLILSEIEDPQNIICLSIGHREAMVIDLLKRKERTERPLTDEFLFNIIRATGCKLLNVFITELTEDTYFAEVLLGRNGKSFKIDCRPSDAVPLALRAEVSIFVAQDLMRTIEELQKMGAIFPEEIFTDAGYYFGSEVLREEIQELMAQIKVARGEGDEKRAKELRDEVIDLMGGGEKQTKIGPSPEKKRGRRIRRL